MFGILELVVLAFYFTTALSLFTAGLILTARPRVAQRGLWVMLALVLPLVGPLLYLALGRSLARPSAPPPIPR